MKSYQSAIKEILKEVASKRLTPKDAYQRLKYLPYEDLGFAKIDHHRVIRRGFPEVVYGKGKSLYQIKKILNTLTQNHRPIILTKISRSVFDSLKQDFKDIQYNDVANVAYIRSANKSKRGFVLVIAGGTSDIPVAEEARITLEIMGNKVEVLYDVGVAGIHRLVDKRDLLHKARVIVVLAGMEGALASVVAGMVSKPVIAVPTSVGYGANFKGLSALLTMLNCCSPGVGVVNIDNGFGAGYLAGLINLM